MSDKGRIVVKGLSGRLGNKLLQHIDAFGYAEKNGLEFFCCDTDCLPYTKKRSSALFDKGVNRNWLLSEVVFDGHEIDVSKYFLNSNELFEKRDSNKLVIGVHYRGTDFAKWKPHSIISPEFYIERIKRFSESVERVVIVTDDIEHRNLKTIVEGVRGWVNVSVFSGCQHADFMRLMQCDLIVASPSTFSLSAAILGGRKIIFPRAYAMVEAEAGAKFWQDCLKSRQSHYVNIEVC